MGKNALLKIISVVGLFAMFGCTDGIGTLILTVLGIVFSAIMFYEPSTKP